MSVVGQVNYTMCIVVHFLFWCDPFTTEFTSTSTPEQLMV